MAEEEKGRNAEKTEAEAESTPKPGRKLPLKLIIIGVVAVALLGGGGYFGWKHFSGGESKEKKVAPAAAESPEGEPGAAYPMEPFIVNLVDPLGRRYLKVKIELELDNPLALEEAKKRDAQMRDSIITLLTSKSYEDIDSAEGKLTLRQEVISRANQFLRTGKAVNAYFTDFVVQ
ncbi:MAG: flagellar basal body-associated FliL family protein [Pseudomonadota bacterium]